MCANRAYNWVLTEGGDTEHLRFGGEGGGRVLLGWHAGGSRGRGEVLLGAARMFPLHPRPPENQNPELPRGSILEGHVRKSVQIVTACIIYIATPTHHIYRRAHRKIRSAGLHSLASWNNWRG